MWVKNSSAGDESAVAEFVKLVSAREKAVKEPAASPEGQETLNVILKADETASLEALKNLILKLSLGLTVKIVDQNVGDLTENDVKRAINTGFRHYWLQNENGSGRREPRKHSESDDNRISDYL